MAAYLAKHKVPVPRYVKNEAWGDGARLLAWRTSTHAGLHPSTAKTQALCNLLFPPDVHQLFRRRLESAYDALLGTKEGSAAQIAIARFCGLSAREPWCAETFWTAAKRDAGYNGERPGNVAYVPAWELFARAHDLIVPNRSEWLPGMGVTFVWDFAKYVGSGDHIGILGEPTDVGHNIKFGTVTHEGNAGGAGTDAVRQEVRPYSCINVVFDLARLQH
jgi:hypothetical protein